MILISVTVVALGVLFMLTALTLRAAGLLRHALRWPRHSL